MSISHSVYSVSHNNSFVIVRREGNFINFFGINLMKMTSYEIHLSILILLAKQALSIVIKLNTPFCNILCHPLHFLSSEPSSIFKSKVYLSNNKFNNLFLTSFILKHSKHFTINSCFYSRWMISRVFTSVKPFLNVGVDIFVKIFALNFIFERVGVGKE